MPGLALAICLLWFLSLFVFRTLVQWRKTGSTGLKGFHGAPFSSPWLAGMAISSGIVLTPLAPIGALLGWPPAALLIESPALHLTGGALAVLGTLGALASQLSMGESWRVGVDESEKTTLVTAGLFGIVRNPIFSFMLLSVAGLVLLVPSALALAAAALTVAGIEVQVRRVEEPYLRNTHGESYERYAARVGRFVPKLGRVAPSGALAVATQHGHLEADALHDGREARRVETVDVTGVAAE